MIYRHSKDCGKSDKGHLSGLLQVFLAWRPAPRKTPLPEAIQLKWPFHFLCRTPDDTKGLPCPRGMVQNIGQGVRFDDTPARRSQAPEPTEQGKARKKREPPVTADPGNRRALEMQILGRSGDGVSFTR